MARFPFRFVLAAAGLLATGAAAPAQDSFAACVDGLHRAASEAGISAPTWDAIAPLLQPNDVLHFQTEQPEFHTEVWDYMAGLVDDERVADGRARARDYARPVAAVAARFGVPGSIVLALWGVESDYGRTAGSRPVVQSLATLACGGRRPAYFRGEFVAALQILQRGEAAPDNFNGSWAGAFGHTQFMPTTFLRHAVDMEGDGHPNIVTSVSDALATSANFIRASGWDPAFGWGFEVRLPAGYGGPSGRKNRHPASFWAARGLTRVDGAAIQGPDMGLLLPAGPAGPAFLVTRNFDALFAYNAAEVYALAVGILADRIDGGGPLVTPWPVDDPGLSRVQRRELQSLLGAKGYAVGNPDGVMGTKTLQAVADYQGRIGLPQNGRPSLKVLEALRGGS